MGVATFGSRAVRTERRIRRGAAGLEAPYGMPVFALVRWIGNISGMASVFISYSHSDQDLRGQLDKHLSLLKRQGHVDVWTDHCIRPGEAFEPAIAGALDTSDIVLLLVSPDFIHSDYCYGVEMTTALERSANGEATVIPVILRPCDWHSAPFGRLKALPTDGKPVVKFQTYDDGFLDVVSQLRALVTKSAAKALANSSEDGGSPVAAAPSLAPAKRSSNLNLPRQFTDLDRAEFVQQGYEDILEYFDNSLKELEARNSSIQTKLQRVTAIAFTATIFNAGKKMAGCAIRQGSIVGSNGISYLDNDDANVTNANNESLAIADNKHMLGWKSMFGGFMSGNANALMTHEGAASHLWDMFVRRL